MMVINTNVAASRASRLLVESNQALTKSLARLSSGSRIVSPEDDAAGLAQAFKLDNRVTQINAEMVNKQNFISFLQTKAGYLENVTKAVQRIDELSMLIRDATKTDSDKAAYQDEIDTLMDYLSAAEQVTFNGIRLFADEDFLRSDTVTSTQLGSQFFPITGVLGGGSPGARVGVDHFLGNLLGYRTYIGFNTSSISGISESSGVRVTLRLVTDFTQGDLTAVGPIIFDLDAFSGTGGDFSGAGSGTIISNVGTLSVPVAPDGQSQDIVFTSSDVLDAVANGTVQFQVRAQNEIAVFGHVTFKNGAPSLPQLIITQVRSIEDIANLRARVGADLANAQNELDELVIEKENLAQAVSRIADTDIAHEATQFARQQILVNSGTAMLAQANALPQLALRLLTA